MNNPEFGETRYINMEQGPIAPFDTASKISFVHHAISHTFGNRILTQLKKIDPTLTKDECLFELRRHQFPNGNGHQLEIATLWRRSHGKEGIIEKSFLIHAGAKFTLDAQPLTSGDVSFVETLEQEANLRFALQEDSNPHDFYIPKRIIAKEKEIGK